MTQACKTVRMNSKIEKIGNTGFALRCPIHGLIANENDRSLIEDMQRNHDKVCIGSRTEKPKLSPKKQYAQQEADAYDPEDIETLANEPN